MAWLEFAGLSSGLLCVYLLIRENVWTFPIGLIYALVSVLVMLDSHLYADVLLNGYYVAMNAYGWYFWLYGGKVPGKADLLVTSTPQAYWPCLVGGTVAGVGVMGWLFNNYSNADLAYWDSTTTVMSFLAMWMTARKYIENWLIWLIVDVISTGLYWYKGLDFYALLYAIYLGMAVWGWLAWRRSMTPLTSSA